MQALLKKFTLLFYILLLQQYATAQYAMEYINNNISIKPFAQIQTHLNDYYSKNSRAKGSGYKFWKRYEWWASQHLAADGKLGDIGNKSSTANLLYANTPTLGSTGGWSVIGPTINQGAGTGNGRPNCIAFNPVNNNLVYVGCPQGGIWAGFINVAGTAATWIPMTDDLASLSISSIAINPNDANVMYALTGDGNRKDQYSIGLLKSTDGGYNWQTTGLTFTRTDNQFGFKVLLNPLNTNNVIVCTNVGVYRSYNAGANFSPLKFSPGGSNLFGCYDLEYFPGDTTKMIACAFNALISTSNSGINWTDRSTYLPAGCRRTALAVSPNATAGSAWLYCGRRDSAFVSGSWVSRYKGIYKTTDYGVSWNLINNAPNISGYAYDGSDRTNEQSDIDMDIAISPTNSSIVIAGTENVWKSTNGGSSFGSNATSFWGASPGIPYIHEDINFITYNQNDGALYTGSDGGLYRSTDNGTTWNDLTKGLIISQFYRINVHSTNNDIIVNGAQDAAQNVRVGATSEFIQVANGGGDGMSCMIDFNKDDTLYTSYAENFYRSYDGGVTSTNIKPTADNGLWVTPMAMDYSFPSTIYFASATPNRVYRSNDNGTSWSNIGGSAQTDLISCPSSINRLYGVTSNVIWRTSNATTTPSSSVTWTSISTGNVGFPQDLGGGTSITRLSVHPDNHDLVWFCAGGYNDTLKVYRSSNGGNTWTNVSAGLPNVAILSIACADGAVGVNGVYVGTDIGVFYRDDVINNWIPYRNGLPAVPVTDLRFNYGINKIRCATYGRGIWESDLYQSCQSTVLVIGNLGGNLNYEASNSILATAQMQQGVGSNMVLKAGGYVRMQPGFNISGGSTLNAKIAPCGSGFINAPLIQNASSEKNINYSQIIVSKAETNKSLLADSIMQAQKAKQKNTDASTIANKEADASLAKDKQMQEQKNNPKGELKKE